MRFSAILLAAAMAVNSIHALPTNAEFAIAQPTDIDVALSPLGGDNVEVDLDFDIETAEITDIELDNELTKRAHFGKINFAGPRGGWTFFMQKKGLIKDHYPARSRPAVAYIRVDGPMYCNFLLENGEGWFGRFGGGFKRLPRPIKIKTFACYRRS